MRHSEIIKIFGTQRPLFGGLSQELNGISKILSVVAKFGENFGEFGIVGKSRASFYGQVVGLGALFGCRPGKATRAAFAQGRSQGSGGGFPCRWPLRRLNSRFDEASPLSPLARARSLDLP